MLTPSSIRRLLVAACLLPLVGSFGCKDQRGDPTGPNTGVLNGDSIFFTAYISLALYNYHNQLAMELLDIVMSGGITQPVLEESCGGSGGVRVIEQEDPMTFTVNHLTPGFVFLASPFSLDPCGGFLRITANRELIVTFEQVPDTLDAAPDSLRYTMTFPDNGTPNTGVGYALPAAFGGTVLSTTGRIECELVNIVHDGSGRIQSGLLHQTTLGGGGHTVRLENRADFLLLVEELDLVYEWPLPTPRDECADPFPPGLYAPFPLGGYEIAGFTSTGFGGTLTGFPVQIEFDGCSKGVFTVGDDTCMIDLVTCQSDCGTIRDCTEVFQ